MREAEIRRTDKKQFFIFLFVSFKFKLAVAIIMWLTDASVE
jgi:hypothetical protein